MSNVKDNVINWRETSRKNTSEFIIWTSNFIQSEKLDNRQYKCMLEALKWTIETQQMIDKKTEEILLM